MKCKNTRSSGKTLAAAPLLVLKHLEYRDVGVSRVARFIFSKMAKP